MAGPLKGHFEGSTLVGALLGVLLGAGVGIVSTLV